MGELYLRKVVLDIVSSRGGSKRIEDLRIRFKCEKINESNPNNADIEIFNLSDATRSLLEAKNTKVRLSIGYLGLNPNGIASTGIGSTSNVDMVFIGDVSKVTHKIERPDIITKVEVADGENRYRNATLDKGYPPNVKLSAILRDLNTALGIPKGSQSSIPVKNYANGVALSGLVRDHLTVLTKSNGLEWSIQDETLQILPTIGTTTDSAVFLSSDTGLVGSPSKTDKGVQFECLIQPSLRPGKKVKIDSTFLKGTYKLRKVVHEGDSHAGDFLSKCEATK